MEKINKKYRKKVIVTDELSTPEARAQRLRRLRNMANLSRDDMCNNDELNLNTYKGWELARVGGLPIDGAERVIKRISIEGVICSLEWLLYGKGQTPYVISKPVLLNNKNYNLENEEPLLILKEISLFQGQYQDAIYMEIPDDALSPYFNEGDNVAGVNQYGDKIIEVLEQNCIVQTDDGKIMARYLKKGSRPNTFNLLSTNPQTKIQEPTLYDISLKSAAPIIRHYIKSPVI